MKKLLLFLLLLTTHYSLFTKSSLAVSPTPLASSVPLEEVQKIRQAVQDKVQEKLKELTGPRDTKRGVIGAITKIDSTRLTIDYQNSQKIIDVDPEAVIIDAKRQKTTLDKIKVGQNVLVMGNITSSDSIDAKRLVVFDPTTLVRRQIVLGKVADISQSSPVMVLIPLNNKNLQYQIKTDSVTEVTDKSGTKVNIKVLTSGQKIIAVLKQDPKNSKTFTAAKLILLDSAASASSTSPTPKPASN